MNTRTDSVAATATANATGGLAENSRARAAVPAMLAILFGTMLIVGAGFAHSSTLHNAAHDARHAFAFPCH